MFYKYCYVWYDVWYDVSQILCLMNKFANLNFSLFYLMVVLKLSSLGEGLYARLRKFVFIKQSKRLISFICEIHCMSIGSVGITEDVLPEDYLDLSNGVYVKNIKELISNIKKMDKETFGLYVTKSRNDFAEWILEAYNEERLAKKILGITDKTRIIRALESALKNYDKKKIVGHDMKIREPDNKKTALKRIGEVKNEL